jgi:hypothetical protein
VKKTILILLGGLALTAILAAGTFTAVQLLNPEQPEEDLPAGAMVFEDVFDDGSGNPVTVKTIVEPAAELPQRPAEAGGIFLRAEDNSYFVGTGSISLNVSVINGERSVAAEHSGPELEVIVGHDTVFYEDVTELQFEAQESKEQRIQQKIREAEQPDKMPETANITAWGERRGDRVFADIIIFSEVQ